MPDRESKTVASQETPSLLKRLAGPSTGKAGLAKDQSEINRIIAEASKGSKFYENEKKKDKDLTERIQKILKLRDETLKGVDPRTIEHSADRLIADIESQRDLSQIIVHIDMDAYFANVELLDNPSLLGKPFGVGRGVLTTASYEARKYGVRSGMPGFIAKKLCPDLIFVENHFSRYMEMSNAVMSVFKRYDPNLLAAGCDEAFLNITSYCVAHNLSASDCVQEMREIVFQETKLTASAGIAPTKMLAKICSDKNKPNGQFELPFDKESIISFLHDLSIRKVPGVGRVNERLLESIGIRACGDIYVHRAIVYLMDKQFGRQYLFRTYLGVTSNVVEPMAREDRKSIGAERTFSSLSDKEKILHKLEEIAIELEKDMQQNGWTGRTVTLKFKLDTYQVFTRAKSFDRWITRKEDLYATGKELILPEFPLTIRLIGLRVTKLKDVRAPIEPVNSIKRFFEPAQNVQSKKKAAEQHDGINLESMDYESMRNGDWNETMPGFHEHDEDDHDLQGDFGECVNPQVISNLLLPSSTPSFRIPGLTNTEVMQHLESVSASCSNRPTAELHSTGHVIGAMSPRPNRQKRPRMMAEDEHDCPVCGKTLSTDNDGLNSHIDFCLSRDAIRQAHAESCSPVKKTASLNFKPVSRGKGKGKN